LNYGKKIIIFGLCAVAVRSEFSQSRVDLSFSVSLVRFVHSTRSAPGISSLTQGFIFRFVICPAWIRIDFSAQRLGSHALDSFFSLPHFPAAGRWYSLEFSLLASLSCSQDFYFVFSFPVRSFGFSWAVVSFAPF
jgi:hypothetical protein